MGWHWLAVFACACNTVYGLDETQPAPPIVDQDGDGTADTTDNCPLIANPDQADVDGDRFGDLCDMCPDLASTNHDEDRDTRGDECDLCPSIPDFGLDSDGDGVGDDCDHDQATKNALVVFDPFVTIGDAWEPVTTPWISNGDAAVPAEVDTRLAHKTARVASTRQLWIEIGFGSSERWRSGDSFGVELVDANTGEVRAACRVSCGPSCILARFPATTDPANPPPQATTAPAATLDFNHTITISTCILDDIIDADSKTDFGEAKLVLVGSPRVHVRYVFVVQ